MQNSESSLSIHWYSLLSPSSCRAVGSRLQTLDELTRTQPLERDLVDLLEQWVCPNPLSCQQEVVDFFGGCCSLEFLTVEQLCFDFGEWFSGFDEFFGAFTISTTVTCRD